MSVPLLIDTTRRYSRARSLPVRLPLGLLCKGIGLVLARPRCEVVGVIRLNVIWVEIFDYIRVG